MSGSSESERPVADGDPAAEVSPGARPEVAPAADAPTEPRARGAWLSGAVAGAVAAALVAFVLDAVGLFQRTDLVLTSRIAALEGLAPDLRSDAASLGQRVTAVEQRPMPETDLAPLRDDIAALRESLAKQGESLARQADAAEMARASLDQGQRELRETASGLTLSLAEQRARIDALAAQRPDLQPLADGLDKAQGALAAQTHQLADLTRRLEALESTLVATRVASTQTAGLALALIELDRALDAGEPLAAALDPFVALQADPEVKAPLDLLQPLRSRGAPTVADLQASLTRLQPRIAEAMRQDGASGWIGKTAQNLASLVDLRRVDAQEAAIDAKLAEAAQALGRGEVDGAAAALRPLAETGNAAAAEWLAEARLRMDGEAGLERLRAYLAAHMPASP